MVDWVIFFLNASTFNVYKKLRSGWRGFGTLKGGPGERGMRGEAGPKGEPGLRGEGGPRGEQSPSDPFHLLPFIAQHAYYYVYIHPSRFESIERTSKNNYTVSNLLDFMSKTIPVNSIEIVKDGKWFYTTLERRRVIHVQERFDNMFENNKAFAMFQVFEVHRPHLSQDYSLSHLS